MVVTSFSCTSCCFFSSADFQVCASHFSIHNCNITCLVSLLCNVQLFLSLLSDALLSGYKLHHHLDPERSHGVCKSKCEVHGADICSAIFACSMNIVHIYAIFFSEAQCVLIRIKKSTKMWTKPWCGTSFVQLTQVHILLGWDPRMKLTVTSLLGWGYCWAAAQEQEQRFL